MVIAQKNDASNVFRSSVAIVIGYVNVQLSIVRCVLYVVSSCVKSDCTVDCSCMLKV